MDVRGETRRSHRRVIRARNFVRTSPRGDAKAMTMRRWRYKEKRPTKVTIYNQHVARRRMNRTGVKEETRRRKHEKGEEDRGEEEEEEETEATAAMPGGADGRIRRHDDILIMGATKRGRKRGIKERRSKKGILARGKGGGRGGSSISRLRPFPFCSFSRFLI